MAELPRGCVPFGAGVQCRGFEVCFIGDIMRLANFESKTTLSINEVLVSFRFRNPPEADIQIMRISESGHWRYGAG